MSDVAGSFKDQNKDTEDNLRARMGITLGAAQYRPGTDLWATKRIGLLSAPNFGRFLSKDKYRRITRYLSGRRGGANSFKMLENSTEFAAVFLFCMHSGQAGEGCAWC